MIAWLLHSATYALDLPNLPFLGKKASGHVELQGNTLLLKHLEEELSRQRKNNRQLQQYSKRSKITRYESQLLNERLRAEGYYAAKIKVDLQPERITYHVDSGPVYRVRNLTVKHPKHLETLQDVITLKTGDPLRAEAVLAAKKSLATYVEDKFCLYRIDVDYRVAVEHQTHSADVTFIIEDSPAVRFGDINFIGLQSIDEDYLRARLPIKKDECYKPKRIDVTRLTLIQSNLLASVNAEVKSPENGAVPITLHVVERHHRRLSAGIGFESDEGFGVSASWEHRNLLGRAQNLTIDSHIAQNAETLSSRLTLPHFKRDNQSITFFADLEKDNTEAFDSKSGTLGSEISRRLYPHLRGLVGGEMTFSQVEEDGVNDNFALLSVSLSLEYDRRNDPLDPLSGWAASARVQPYWDAYDTGTKFLKSTLAASAYYTFEKFYWRPTLAIRAAAGSISGIDREQVPANVRFYTGGGGSVRGYSYQSLGPLTDKEPDGGLSFTELSIESRLRWDQHWGGVIFLDGGFSYEDNIPQFGRDLRWSTGVGLRYFTSFAPIRIDIALPLNKREDIDDSYKLYISIGQAF